MHWTLRRMIWTNVDTRKVFGFIFGTVLGVLFVLLFSVISFKYIGPAQITYPLTSLPKAQGKKSSSIRLLCWITTMPANHKLKAVHVKSTWAPRCDAYMFMSSINDPSLPSIAAVPLEGREYLWQKTQFALRYVWKNYGDEFDFFYKADDDTYALIDNLRLLLAEYDPHTPVLIGQAHMAFIKPGYPSGGAGYVMSRAALKNIVQGMENTSMCYDKRHKDFEDVKVGACAEALGIPLIHSIDKSGHFRFYCYSPFSMLRKYGLNAQLAFLNQNQPSECCAANPISFHYIKPEELYFLDYLLYTARSPELF